MVADRHKNRSDRYQPIFAELSYSNEMLAEFSDAQGMVENYSPEDRERLLDLKDDLLKEFWRLVDQELTPRQAEVIKLYAKGYTQIEIAKTLGVNQSSITKSINGNCDYRSSGKKSKKKNKRSYGGSKRKLRRLINEDDKIKTILEEIASIHSFYTYC